MTFTCKLMDLDRPNLNRTIYSKDAIKNALEKCSEVPIYLDSSASRYFPPTIDSCAGIAKLQENYPEVYIEGQFNDTPAGRLAGELLSCQSIDFALQGIAHKQALPDGTTLITDATVDSVNMQLRPSQITIHDV